MTKLPVVSTVHAAYGFVFAQAADLVKVALFPALVGVAIWTGLDWLQSQGHSGSLGVISNLVYAWFGFFWHRRVLLGAEAARMSSLGRNTGDPEQSKWFNRFILRSLLYGLLIFVLVGVPAAVVTIGFLENPVGDQWAVILYILGIGLCIWYPLSAVFLRFALMFPAIAVGGDAGWGEAWRTTAGNAWRLANIGALTLIAYLPVLGLAFAVLFFLPDLGPVDWVLVNLLSALVAFPITAVQVTWLSLAFKALAPERYEAALAQQGSGGADALGETSD